MPPSKPFAAAEAALRSHALAFPLATEHFPWGERAIKVKGKVFLFMFADAARLSLSVKLPSSSHVALLLPFASPTGYGLGKAGWVSAAFEPGDQPPVDMLCAWIDESYQAVAPAKLAAQARTAPAAPATPTKPAKPAKPKQAAKPSSPKPAKSPAAKSPTAKLATESSTAKPKQAAKPSSPKLAKPAAKSPTAKSSTAKLAAKSSTAKLAAKSSTAKPTKQRAKFAATKPAATKLPKR